MKRILFVALLAASPALAAGANEDDDAVMTFSGLKPDFALQAAQAAMHACRDGGYQVGAAVVDRSGVLQAFVRDRFAGAHTVETARRKAWTAVSFRSDTQSLVSLTAPESPQAAARDISGALMLGGGVPIEAAGSIVGGVGVSGAPGGDA